MAVEILYIGSDGLQKGKRDGRQGERELVCGSNPTLTFNLHWCSSYMDQELQVSTVVKAFEMDIMNLFLLTVWVHEWSQE